MDKVKAEGFYRGTFAAFDTPQLIFNEVLESGDSVTIGFTMTGTHMSGFMGVPSTGRKIALPGITILRFEGDTAVERWPSADMPGLLIQLGAVPAPS